MKKLIVTALLAAATASLTGCAGFNKSMNEAAARREAEQQRQQAAWNALTPTQRRITRRQQCAENYHNASMYVTSQLTLDSIRSSYAVCMNAANDQM